MEGHRGSARGGCPPATASTLPSWRSPWQRADGSEIGTILVGKREGDRVFVRTKASPAIYALEARQLGDLPNVPDDFKG